MVKRNFLPIILLCVVLPLGAEDTAVGTPAAGTPAAGTPARVLRLKSAPANAALSLDGETLTAQQSAGGIRDFLLEGDGIIRLSAPGYRSREFPAASLTGLLRDGLLQLKLERDLPLPLLLQEIATGGQPKSAYFSPEGNRLFVPLLADPGVDVFRLETAGSGAAALRYEKRLQVPDAAARPAAGFVEALCDPRRRELWVSNMEEHKIHIWDLDSLEYKTGFSSGGSMPKVLVLNPAGDTVAVSNWLSQDVVFFDAAAKTQRFKIPTGGTPRGMAFSPDGNLLYTAIFDRPEIAVIDLTEKKVVRRISLSEGTGAARHIILRDGKLYVSDMYKGTVNIVNAADGKVLKSLRVGPNINTIVLSPDGRQIAASSRGLNNPSDYTKPGPDFGAVTILSSEDLSILSRVYGRNQPTGLAISPDGNFMAFTDFLDQNLELYRIK